MDPSSPFLSSLFILYIFLVWLRDQNSGVLPGFEPVHGSLHGSTVFQADSVHRCLVESRLTEESEALHLLTQEGNLSVNWKQSLEALSDTLPIFKELPRHSGLRQDNQGWEAANSVEEERHEQCHMGTWIPREHLQKAESTKSQKPVVVSPEALVEQPHLFIHGFLKVLQTNECGFRHSLPGPSSSTTTPQRIIIFY